ncbi:anti-sigma regulatory factor [Streptomyces xanthochromogenes]|uniref:Anti-sigma regulatory factor n=1 Tax=Streptomyces xanthochromogenes TaxID=67384 RepID=A0ABQ3AJM1_9ACTN|nr:MULTISPECIES: anti-sigma regulatory factor [Streptomyces]MYV91222.1 anti-sigma regulatory factor [Streptomyces sp. SID1034]GGY57920.1 anti-sigma regulatory factor [Streptomyces xanthochromogenes]GHB38960.1 anti-sigma regulatory factor [Streptomyces xanthochromogenes]
MTGPSRTSEVLEITTTAGVVQARQQVRVLAQQCRLSLVDQTKLITAASELARNTLVHGGGGTMTALLVEERARRGVRLSFADHGPGIADVDLALTDGWTSGTGMGLGLSGSKRLVDDFVLDTTPGEGTTVTITKWGR